MEYCSAIKNNEIMSFVATWMDPEIIILSEVSQRQETNIMWHCLHVESKKVITDELVYKTEMDIHTENKCILTKGEKVGG